MRKVSGENYREIETHNLCSKPPLKNGAIYEIMSKNMAQPKRA
jgi:hypothetical protein